MKKLALLASLIALGLGIAACGGDDDDEGDTTEAATTTETTTTEETTDSGGAGGSVELTADPDGALAYEQQTLSAPAGPVTIEFDNPASVGHDVVVEGPEGDELARTEVITEDSATAEAELAPGEYTFFCSVPGHREAGMEGTLTAE